MLCQHNKQRFALYLHLHSGTNPQTPVPQAAHTCTCTFICTYVCASASSCMPAVFVLLWKATCHRFNTSRAQQKRFVAGIESDPWDMPDALPTPACVNRVFLNILSSLLLAPFQENVCGFVVVPRWCVCIEECKRLG